MEKAEALMWKKFYNSITNVPGPMQYVTLWCGIFEIGR